MASEVDIVNIALSHLGADAVVTQLKPPDGSVEAGQGEWFSPILRRTHVALAQLVNDLSEWTYRYALPQDCLRARRVIASANSYDLGAADYEIEGGALYTNQSGAVLIYTRDVTDTTKYPADFVTGLGVLLAGYLAGPIIKGREAITIGDAWTKAGLNALREAAVRDANASQDSSNVTARPALHPGGAGTNGAPLNTAALDGILDNIASAVWNKVLP